MRILSARVVAVLVLSSSVACAAPLAAGESGEFVFLVSVVHDYTVLEHAGQTITGGPLEGTGAVVESSGAPFAEGANYRATCLVYAKKSDAGIDLEAPCAFTDADGDSWYAMAERRAGDVEVGGGGQGNQRIVGGTGKYAGVAGNCPYTTGYLPDNWLVSTSACEWRKP